MSRAIRSAGAEANELCLGLLEQKFGSIKLARRYNPAALPYAYTCRRFFMKQCVTYATGLGVLYRVVEKFGIEAGGEFL